MKDLNSFFTVGKYNISTICLSTYPCKHYVTNNETNETFLYTGDRIYTLLKNDGLSHKHFDLYEEFIRKRDFPTPEEIVQKNKLKMEYEENLAKQKKEQEERNQIINSTKASSRLDRLKTKHCTSS